MLVFWFDRFKFGSGPSDALRPGTKHLVLDTDCDGCDYRCRHTDELEQVVASGTSVDVL